jgi:hypothetical protein
MFESWPDFLTQLVHRWFDPVQDTMEPNPIGLPQAYMPALCNIFKGTGSPD